MKSLTGIMENVLALGMEKDLPNAGRDGCGSEQRERVAIYFSPPPPVAPSLERRASSISSATDSVPPKQAHPVLPRSSWASCPAISSIHPTERKRCPFRRSAALHSAAKDG